jgi:hypothetical protein
MRTTLALIAALAATPVMAEGSTARPTCLVFDEDQQLTLRGDIVQSATTEGSEGQPPHKYMTLILDGPICFARDKDEKLTFIEVYPIPPKWLGHHVAVTGSMLADDSWSIDVKGIKDAP